MAVIIIKVFLLRPKIVARCPGDRSEGGGILCVPEMDTNILIRAVTCGRGSVVVPVPATLQSNIRIINCLQIEEVDRPCGPIISSIAVCQLLDGVIRGDVE